MICNQNYIGASARIQGSHEYPGLHGNVTFWQKRGGVLVTAKIYGLPDDGPNGTGVFAFHIHEGRCCSGNINDPFADVEGHYNPENCEHPYHAGDLPPLFSNRGYAYMSVFTDRFTIKEIIGRTVIIHAGVDDFTSQPSGNAGAKIGCGQICAQQ